jgi:hypothetical protein
VHIVVCWEIVNAPDRESWEMWNERLKEVINAFQWVRPIRSVYVVTVQEDWQRLLIVHGLTRVSEQSSGMVRVLMSPTMIGGRYGGVLPKELWVELNQLTAQGQQRAHSQEQPTRDDHSGDQENFDKEPERKKSFWFIAAGAIILLVAFGALWSSMRMMDIV